MNSFRIPLFEKAGAASGTDLQLVSIIVHEDVYDSIKAEVKRYATDIQGKLNNTKALIYVVPKEITPQKVAALNERLYFEGEGDSASRLAGTIIVGDIPIPVIHQGERTFLSVYPYTDFKEKNFIFNQDKGYYEESVENTAEPNPEIWHGVIAPNTGNVGTDRTKLKEFFDKDHAFYAKQGVFASSLPDPYVFYFDGKRDEETASKTEWNGYKIFLRNLEDITYHRYNKYLATKISKEFFAVSQGDMNLSIKDSGGASQDIIDTVNSNLGNSVPDLKSAPDIMTKKIIDGTVKRFYQVFNGKYIGDILKYAYNTGRYGNAKDTRVDMPLTLISKRDVAMQKILKDTNTSMEGMVDHLVDNGLSRYLAVPQTTTEHRHARYNIYDWCSDTDSSWICNVRCQGYDMSNTSDSYWGEYRYLQFVQNNYVGVVDNYFYGTKASTITNANQCTTYRGSRRTNTNKSVLVDASRAYDLRQESIEKELNLLKVSPNEQTCFSPKPKTMAFWGGHSILNYDTSDVNDPFKLKPNQSGFDSVDHRRATLPIYEISGGKEIGYNWSTDVQDPKNDELGRPINPVTPMDCWKFNWLYTNPDNLNPLQKRCDSRYSEHVSPYGPLDYENGSLFENLYLNKDRGKVYFSFLGPYDTHNRYLFLDGVRVGAEKPYLIEEHGACPVNLHFIVDSEYYFNKIPSSITHKSPTDEELGAQFKAISTPSLPSDRDRYIDFISAKGQYAKIVYPNLFRVDITNPNDLNYNGAKKVLKQYLDQKSAEVNNVIVQNKNVDNPDLADVLKTGPYPSPNIDFFAFLSKNPKVLDEAVKNVLWYNFETAEQKYDYIFGHYLDIDGNSLSLDTSHKSDYEIVYLGGKGDPENLYVRIDPEKNKTETSSGLKDVMGAYDAFKSANMAVNLTNPLNQAGMGPATENAINGAGGAGGAGGSLAAGGASSASSGGSGDSGSFSCGGAEGVPIPSWISAINCWLGKLVPPISVQSGKCSSNTLFSDAGSSGGSSAGGTSSNEYRDVGLKYVPMPGNPSLFTDANGNGIMDGAEQIFGGTLVLASENPMYSYGQTVRLKASLLKNGQLITSDSSSKVKFDIVSLISYDKNPSGETIYTQGNIGNLEDVQKYISFSPAEVNTKQGESTYAFSTIGSDVDVILTSSITTIDKDKKMLYKESSPITLKVRGTRLDITPMSGSGYISTITAGEIDALDFHIDTYDKYNQPVSNNNPIKVDMLTSTGVTIFADKTTNIGKFTFSEVSYGDWLKRVGTYTFVFTDANDFTAKQTIEVIPGAVRTIEVIPSSTKFMSGSEIEVLVMLKDEHGNRVSGELNPIEGVIEQGPGLFNVNNSKSVSGSILEGYANYRVKYNPNESGKKILISFHLKNDPSKQGQKEVEVITDAKVRVSIDDPGNINAGGAGHKINLTVVGTDNLPIQGLDGLAYFDINNIYGAFTPNYGTIKNGQMTTEVYFYPNYAAGKDIRFDVVMPGVKTVEGNAMTILPGKPMYLGLTNVNPRIEAKDTNPAKIRALLYDRYGNVTTNDSSHSVKFEILNEYRKYVYFGTSGSRAYSIDLPLNKGSAEITAKATDIPGSAYIKATVSSPLEANTYTKKETQGGITKEITIKGVSATAIAFDSYYFFNKSKLANIDYNGLHTVLQGASYGDITHPGYLGGEILFNRTGRSLSVTSLLNYPYEREMAFGFTPGGKFTFDPGGSKDQTFTLEPHLISTPSGTSVELYDSVYKELIARAWLNFKDSANLVNCGTSEKMDITECNVPTGNSYILMKGGKDTSVSSAGGKLLLKMGGFEMLNIDTLGKLIQKDPSVTFEFDDKAVGNILGIRVLSNGAQIAYLGYKFRTEKLDVVESNDISAALNDPTKSNQIVIEKISNDYYADNTFLGTSSHGAIGKAFYRTLDTTESAGDQRLISRSGKLGLENYAEQAGIGWEVKNKMLLEFAAGSPLGEATVTYDTYSSINLGDPVVSLDKRKSADSDFDKTIGKKLLDEGATSIDKYAKYDFNKDGDQDIVVFYGNGDIRLLLNHGGVFKDMGNVAHVADMGSGRKGAGDFDGDGYGDIAFVTKDGSIGMLVNVEGKYVRGTPKILGFDPPHGPTSIGGTISQMEFMDMDADGKMDIAILDDGGTTGTGGELSVLYGKGRTGAETIFHKKVLESGLGIKLDAKVETGGGAIYYQGLPQLDDFSNQSSHLIESQSLANQVTAGLASGNGADMATSSAAFGNMLDRLIYYQEKYKSDAYSGALSQSQIGSVLDSTVGTNAAGQPDTALSNQIQSSLNAIAQANSAGMTDLNGMNPDSLAVVRTYLRSQFAEARKIKVEKTFADANGGMLKTGDLINVTLKITNSGPSELKDVIYLDSNKNFLKPTETASGTVYKISSPSIGAEIRPMKPKIDGEFDYVYDNFAIKPGETAVITYDLVMPQVSYGSINIGATAPNSQYADVSFSPNNQCGADQLFWKNIDGTTYQKGLKTFNDTTALPPELAKNAVDNNHNGIPDYIDDLAAKGAGNYNPNSYNIATGAFQDYAKTQLGKFTKDGNGNGIPDLEDEPGSSVFAYDMTSGNITIGGLNDANLQAIDSAIDSVVQGLGCGFGGGSCISMPLNQALMAPGSSMTLFGMPITPGVGLVGMGSTMLPLPIFAAPTSCIIPVWPPCPKDAGGIFDKPKGNGTSMVRLFITPTITGAVGLDVCFGPNALYELPPGTSPLVSGGRCITASMPLVGCNDDGSDGNVASQGSLMKGTSNGSPGGGSKNTFFNANSCTKPSDSNAVISAPTTENIVKYMLGDKSLASSILSDAAVQHGGLSPDSGPSMSASDSTNSLDVSLDADAIKNRDFGNIVKVNFKRVSSFPDFIMDWVNNQLEEIVNKLTSFPTLYIILPDLSGIASGWSGFSSKYDETIKKINEKNEKERKKNEQTAKAESAKLSNQTLQSAQQSLNGAKSSMKNIVTTAKSSEFISSIRSAYDVIGNMPLVSIKSQKIDINIPWIGPEEIDDWIVDAKGKKEQYKNELDRATANWVKFSTGGTLSLSADVNKLVSSIDKNIQILEEYKKFPEKFRKYLNWKEEFLTQILCNLEVISKVIGGWIADNGKRFRAWVNLIILIKAILKSWQALVDIFVEFNQNCSVCHNERNNLTYWLIKLISALIPSLPVIQFPKWPDIIIDLHNIKVGLNILMPDFEFKVVPIVLPTLPTLRLPGAPNISIGVTFPQIPILPKLPELPNLPELPSLPDIKLPDLPPPFTVPNLFASISATIKILKLFTKVLCLWRKIGNILVPEWRSGDAIAWNTERNGTMPMDKLFIDIPNISIPFASAIKVTSYVNMQFDVDFIVEMAKSTLTPFNNFTTDLSHIGKDKRFQNINLDPVVPDVNVNVNVSPQGYNRDELEKFVKGLASFSVQGVSDLLKGLQKGKKEYALDEFKQELAKDIGSLASTTDKNERYIYDTINKALSYDGKEEKKVVDNLMKAKDEKFGILKEMVSNEIDSNKKLKKEMDEIVAGRKSIKDFSPLQKFKTGTKISASDKDAKKDALYEKLSANQLKVLDSIGNLADPKEDRDMKQIEESGRKILDKAKSGVESFRKEVMAGKPKESPKNELQTGTGSVKRNFAAAGGSSSLKYSYDYEGIYVMNAAGKQTRLFDYIDQVDKDSVVVEIDADNDGDSDVIYLMAGALYLKENLSKSPAIKHVSGVDGTRYIDDINEYLHISDDADPLPFAPNFFNQVSAGSRVLNFRFLPANPEKDTAFRLEYYDYIERFDQTNNEKQKNIGMNPFARLNFIDMRTSSDSDITESTDDYVLRENAATFGGGAGSVNITMNNYKVMSAGAALTVQEGKTIYAGDDKLIINYKVDEEDEYKTVTLNERSSMEFLNSSLVSVVSGDMILFYDGKKTFTGSIQELKGFPVLPGTKMELPNPGAQAKIEYIRGSELMVDNRSSYSMIDLGEKSDAYSVSIRGENGFYYAKMYEFSDGKRSTITNLSLLSPQFEADNNAPFVSVEDGIRVPVYKKLNFNLKPFIEDVSGIEEVYVDFDPQTDGPDDADTIADNDKDSLAAGNPYKMTKGSTIFDLEVGPFNILQKKKVMLVVRDKNGNITKEPVDFEVYAPVPNIESYDIPTGTGILDEIISDEPIDFFRFRNGALERLGTPTQSKTDGNGTFDFKVTNTDSGVILKEGGTTVALVDEKTGNITIKDADYGVRVIPADPSNRTKFQIYKKAGGVTVYEEVLNLPSNQNIAATNDFGNATKEGIYFRSEDDTLFRFVKNPSNAVSLPNGGFVVENSTNRAIVGIGYDGNLYVTDPSYVLTYLTNSDSITVGIKSSGGDNIGTILYRIDSEYLIK